MLGEIMFIEINTQRHKNPKTRQSRDKRVPSNGGKGTTKGSLHEDKDQTDCQRNDTKGGKDQYQKLHVCLVSFYLVLGLFPSLPPSRTKDGPPLLEGFAACKYPTSSGPLLDDQKLLGRIYKDTSY